MKKHYKILITGHKGYIGSKLFERLKNLGHHVDGIDLKEGEDILHSLPGECAYDFIFHMAALPRVEYSVINPSYTLMHNVLGTSKLLEWAAKGGAKRVIFSSSSAIYGDGSGPNSPYGLHKWMSEQECSLMTKLYDMDTVCLRYFNVYSKDQPFGGAYSTVISAWINMIKEGKPLRIDGDGEQTRDFIHVDDIVDANIFCMNYERSFGGSHYDVGTGQFISLNEIREIVQKYHSVEWKFSPSRQGDVRHTCANTLPLATLGWKAKISIRDGINNSFT
jgi:UDP-glucose 4-epimerase